MLMWSKQTTQLCYSCIHVRIVKLSSPNLNYLIIIGAGFLYMSVYMFLFTAGREPTFAQTILCNVSYYAL